MVAAGNFGTTGSGQNLYGTVGSPGTDPSVITVGATNFKNTVGRSDDVVTGFSSKGPTRGARVVDGITVRDNLLKPDLVAPGNRIVGAGAASGTGTLLNWNLMAAQNLGVLVTPLGLIQTLGETQMLASGTSIAAPVVAGRPR